MRRLSRRAGRGREAHQEGQEELGGTPEVPRGVGRPSRTAGRCQKDLLEGQERSRIPQGGPEGTGGPP